MLSRRIAVGIAAGMLGWLGLGIQSAGASEPPACDGVWVVVQTRQDDPGSVSANCASEFGNGLIALRSAGFDVESKGGVINRISSLPKDADYNSNGGYYWSYWSAELKAGGELGGWNYYQVGAEAAKPREGGVEGWLLTNKQDATGPAMSNLAMPGASSAPAAVESQVRSTQAQPASGPLAPPPGTWLGAAVVVLGLAGLGGWWWQKGRKL